jgi:hypothetical protein
LPRCGPVPVVLLANLNRPGTIVCRERLGDFYASTTATRLETPRSSFRTLRVLFGG